MNDASHFPDRRTASLFLLSIGLFAFVSLLALLAARLEHLYPDTRLITTSFFGQLLGLHRSLLHFFVLLPALLAVAGFGLLPSGVGAVSLAFPRLARAAWLGHVAGGVLVLWAFFWGGIEPGWATALAHPTTALLIAPSFLAGLLLACLSLQLVALNLIATAHSGRLRSAPLSALALYAASWMVTLAAPLAIAALALGLVQRVFAPGLVIGGSPAILPLLHSLGSGPLLWAALLAVLGASAAALEPERLLSSRTLRIMKIHLCAFAVLGLLAVDARSMPGALSEPLAMLGSLYKALLLVPILGIALPLLHAAFSSREHRPPAWLHTVAALLLIVLFAPLEAFLGQPSARHLASGYLASSSYYLLFGGGILLALLSVVPDRRDSSAPGFAAAILLFGLLATFGPMIPLGLQGLSMDLAVYPVQHMALQVLVFAGCTILALGLLVSALVLRTERGG